VEDVIGRLDAVLDGSLRPDSAPPAVAAPASDAGN
jgi:hypothetical protein